jgi:hypothetical protein
MSGLAGGVLKSDHFDLRSGSLAFPQRRDQKEVGWRVDVFEMGFLGPGFGSVRV